MGITEEAKERNRLAARVRREAMADFVEQHWDDFAALLDEHRDRVGLPPAKPRPKARHYAEAS